MRLLVSPNDKCTKSLTGAWIKVIEAFVIGLINNLLRPLLVGQGARLPDYVVLISTGRGIGLFSISNSLLAP